MKHKASAGVGVGSDLVANGVADIGASRLKSLYKFEAFAPDGSLKWTEEVENLVVNEGLNDLLDKYFKGSTYTAGWFVGLINNAGFTAIAAGDTAAEIDGTNGWAESQAYDEATREALTLGSVAAQSVDNVAARAEFTINASVTINGAFVVSSGTKGGVAGVLYGAASFGSPRAVEDNDTLRVTVTLTAAAA